MSDDVDKKSVKPPSHTVLKLIVICVFSIASYFVWTEVFHTYAGVCVGPVCVQR